jgi:hypothetical protein
MNWHKGVGHSLFLCHNTFVQNNPMQSTLTQPDYRYLPEVYSQDPYSDKKFRFSVDQELTIDEFLDKKKINSFYKICDCKLKTEEDYSKASAIPFRYVPLKSVEHRYNKKGEVVYIITFDSYVVKIGFTTDGMCNRQISYCAGNRNTRKKGTPSTTNFHITEAIYTALRDGKKVEWYAYDVDPKEIEVDYFGTGKYRTVKVSYGSQLEADLIQDYVDLTGHRPILSKNSGKTKKKKVLID